MHTLPVYPIGTVPFNLLIRMYLYHPGLYLAKPSHLLIHKTNNLLFAMLASWSFVLLRTVNESAQYRMVNP